MIVLGVALLLVFLLGRATGGASSGELETLQDRVESLQAQNDQLQAAARARATNTTSPPADTSTNPGATPGATPSASPGTATSPGASPSPSPATGGSSTTLPAEYTVQSGETYSSISSDFYGSSSFSRCIMQANGQSDPTALQAGKTITVPEKPDNPCS